MPAGVGDEPMPCRTSQSARLTALQLREPYPSEPRRQVRRQGTSCIVYLVAYPNERVHIALTELISAQLSSSRLV